MTKSEKSGKAALRQRLIDIAQGACGRWAVCTDTEEGNFITYPAGVECLGRFVAACEVTWGRSENVQDGKGTGLVPSFVFRPEEIAEFDDLDKLVERFWGYGCR